jgi:hypothetical protein
MHCELSIHTTTDHTELLAYGMLDTLIHSM